MPEDDNLDPTDSPNIVPQRRSRFAASPPPRRPYWVTLFLSVLVFLGWLGYTRWMQPMPAPPPQGAPQDNATKPSDVLAPPPSPAPSAAEPEKTAEENIAPVSTPARMETEASQTQAASAKGPARLSPAVAGPYTIQVGAFSRAQHAKTLMKTLMGKGYDAYILKSDLPHIGLRYRVRVGRFPSRAAALQTAHQIEIQEHLALFVTR